MQKKNHQFRHPKVLESKDQNQLPKLNGLPNNSRKKSLQISRRALTRQSNDEGSPASRFNLKMLEMKKKSFWLRQSQSDYRQEVSKNKSIIMPYLKTTMKQKKRKNGFSAQENLFKQLMPQMFLVNNSEEEKKDEKLFFQAFFSQVYSFKILPNVCFDSPFCIKREGPCLTIFNNQLFLMGGAIRRRQGYINREDPNIDILLHRFEGDRWVQEKIDQPVQMQCKSIAWHTVDSVDKFIVMIGGIYGQSPKFMNALNSDITVYNPMSRKVKKIKGNFNFRSHASTVFGHTLLLHGGIGGDGAHLSTFNLLTLRENGIPRILTGFSNLSLAHHKIINTLNLERSQQITLGQKGGIFVFGGERSNGHMDNHLKLIRPNSLDLQKLGNIKFENVNTKGMSPCPRIHHTMNILAHRMSIVVIGGLDNNYQPLCDIWIFDLLQSGWSLVQSEPSIDLKMGAIFKHSAVSEYSKVIVYGGHHKIDQGKSNFFQIDFSSQAKSTKKKRESSSAQKPVCSFWSISPSKHDQPSQYNFQI